MRTRTVVTIGAIVGAAVVLLALLFGLPSPGGEKGASSAVAPAGAPRRQFVRLAITGDAAAGTVAVSRADLISTTAVPLTGAGGYYAVLDGAGGVLDATPFAFSRERVEEFEGPTATIRRPRDVTRASVMVFLPYQEGATGIRILDRKGSTVAALDRAAVTAMVPKPQASSSSTTWQRMRDTVVRPLGAASLTDLQVAFPHILFVTDPSELPSELEDSIAGIGVFNNERATAIFDTLSELNPLLLGSIASLAIVNYANDGLSEGAVCNEASSTTIKRGETLGNRITLNAKTLAGGSVVPNDPAQLRTTLIHESVHAFNNLVDQPDLATEQLPIEVQTKVDDVRDNLGHLYGVLRAAWEQLQSSARIAHRGYGSYVGEQAFCDYPTTASAVKAGFVKPYGGYNAKEDIATYVQVFYDSASPSTGHPICQQFSGLTDEIPRDKLLAFAKINFLRGLGLIEESDYTACVQQADPASQRGFHIAGINFGLGLKAGAIGQDPGLLTAIPGSRFVVLGSTARSRGMLQIYARPPFYSPIGFHRLDDTYGWLTPYVKMKGLKRRNILTVQARDVSSGMEQTRKTRISSGGFAVVVSNLPGDAKGYAFYVPMEDGFGKKITTLDLVWFRER